MSSDVNANIGKNKRGETAPLGKRWNRDGVLVTNEKEIQLFSEVKRLYDEGMSQNRIAITLSQAGWVNRNGVPLQKHNVYTILQKIKETEVV